MESIFSIDTSQFSINIPSPFVTYTNTNVYKDSYSIKKESIIYLFNYYKRIISCNRNTFILNYPQTDPEHLINLCQEAIDNYDKFFSLDKDNSKVNRWLGFIQGVLICNGITSVEKERDFTRPYLTKHR